MSRRIEDMIILKTNESEEFVKRVYDLFLPKIEEKYRQKFPLGHINITYQNDKSIDIKIKDNIRKRDAYVFHSFCGYDSGYDPTIGFMKLYFIDDALRNSSVNEITYILPHIPYQRQDRMDRPRVAINARRTMRMLKEYDSTIPTRVVTFDMHSGQIQGFVNYPVDNLEALPLFLDYFREMGGEYTIVSPDAGGMARAKKFADNLKGSRLVVLGKTRPEAGKVEEVYVIGKEHVKDRDVIIIDDMVDTGGTLFKGADELKSCHAKNIYACCTHPVLSPKKNKETGEIEYYPEDEFPKHEIKLITTDTIPKTKEYLDKNKDWLEILSIAPIVSDAIYEIQTGGSISKLFQFK
jgi:ribose-phosphate pyrophosphokinase